MKSSVLKTVVIDDSKTQRTLITELVRKHPDLELIADYKNGIEARIAMEQEQIDLVFLDVEMPIIDGFDFMESLKSCPQVILITSKSDYAMRAFEYAVTDYLLKPFAVERFNTSVKKALANASDASNATSPDDYVTVNSELKKVNISREDILWIEGVGDYIKVVTEGRKILVLSTMKAFLEKLADDRFMRIHKSYIINLSRVENFTGSKVQIAGRQLPLSRNKKELLEEALLKTS